MSAPYANTFKVVGQKQVYLPNFVVTLMRTPQLGPHYARFKVPLNVNKLDLKDYLYHAYNIKAQRITSFVVQSPVQQSSNRDTRPAPRRWFRPISKKFMTVELDRPFVWPAEPDDFAPWDRDTYEEANNLQETEQKKMMPDANERAPEDADSLGEQAKRLLSGEEQWRPGAQDVRRLTRVMVGKRGARGGVGVAQEEVP